VFDKTTRQVRAPKFEGKYNYRETIGDKLRHLVEDGSLKPEQLDDLTDLLHARYSSPMGRPAPEWIKRMRDVGYAMTIGNPYSTITQFSDVMLAASLSSRGMGGTVFEQVAKRLSGGELTYTLADFGIDPNGLERLLAEFQDVAATTKWLRRNLKATGFSAADVFGKQTLINATFAELRKAARSAPDSNAYKRLVSEYRPALKEEFDDFVEALRKGIKESKADDNVRAAVFGRLLDQHPAALDEMPLGYIKHPQARILYSLKSFTIKQIDLLRKRTLDQMVEGLAKGDDLMVKDAVRDMLKYSILFGGSIQGINWLKDFLLGREVDVSDRSVDYFMQLMGLHRFHIERIRRIAKAGKPSEEAWKMLGGLTPPALSILADSLLPDAVAIATGELELSERGGELSLMGVPTPIKAKHVPYLKAKSWRYIPFIGRDVFWTIGLGEEWEAKRHKKPARGTRRGGGRPSSRRRPSRRR